MNFIESLVESIKNDLKRVTGEYPNEIKTFCIGSGSNFIIHKNISEDMAKELYERHKHFLPLGKRAEKTRVGNFTYEKYHCMESSSGYVYTFMFEISSVIVHNPNDVINEWIQKNKNNDKFMASLLEDLKK